MSVPRTVVDDATRNALLGLAVGDPGILREAVDIREAEQQSSGLDPVTFGLVKIAALIALDSPPASYLWQIANALDDGRVIPPSPKCRTTELSSPARLSGL